MSAFYEENSLLPPSLSHLWHDCISSQRNYFVLYSKSVMLTECHNCMNSEVLIKQVVIQNQRGKSIKTTSCSNSIVRLKAQYQTITIEGDWALTPAISQTFSPVNSNTATYRKLKHRIKLLWQLHAYGSTTARTKTTKSTVLHQKYFKPSFKVAFLGDVGSHNCY